MQAQIRVHVRAGNHERTIVIPSSWSDNPHTRREDFIGTARLIAAEGVYADDDTFWPPHTIWKIQLEEVCQ